MLRFDLGVSMASAYDADGFVGLQVDAFGEKRSGMSAIELHHAFGFASRPLDPANDNTGCSILYAYKGSEGFAWALNDPRLADKIPPLKKGGSAQYDSNGSFFSFDPETRTGTLYVPYAEGKAHLLTIGNDSNGKAIVEFVSGEGPAITILDRVATVTNAPGNAWWQLDDSGTTIIGALKAHGGADLGGTASQPLTKFAPLGAWAAGVQAALAALAAIPTNSAASGPVGAVAGLLAGLVSSGPTVLTKGA